MRVVDALAGCRSCLLDTAPVIYALERHPRYGPAMEAFFHIQRQRGITIVTTPITLAECLVRPLRHSLARLAADYRRLIVKGEHTRFVSLGEGEAELAARIRSEFGLSLTDALQVAAALEAGCDAILTNDAAMARIREPRVLLVGDLEP